jgi:hypothetical protein
LAWGLFLVATLALIFRLFGGSCRSASGNKETLRRTADRRSQLKRFAFLRTSRASAFDIDQNSDQPGGLNTRIRSDGVPPVLILVCA